MTLTQAATVRVHIAGDGTCSIDDEPFAPPPGTPLNRSVLADLRIRAAAVGSPVRAVIRDDQAAYTTAIRVSANGSSVPIGRALDETDRALVEPHAPIPPGRPYDALPEPFRGRLRAICATASQDRVAEAARDADPLINELMTLYGPTHLYTLAASLVRGDIAVLARDYTYGLRIWAFMAKAWHSLLGPTHGTTIRMVGNAVGCWREMPRADALVSRDEVMQLLREVPVPGGDDARRIVSQRLHWFATDHGSRTYGGDP